MSSRLHEILPQKPKGRKETGLNFKSAGTHNTHGVEEPPEAVPHARGSPQQPSSHTTQPGRPSRGLAEEESARAHPARGDRQHPVHGDRGHSPPPLGSERVTCGAWPSAAAVPTGVPRTVYGRLLPAPDERPGPVAESRPHKRLDPGSGLWRSARNSSNAAAMVPSAAPAQWGSGRPNGQVWRAASQRLRRSESWDSSRRLRCQNFPVPCKVSC